MNEIPTKEALDRYKKIGLVDKRVDKERGLNIYVYTMFTQKERLWNYVTLNARGIVYDDKGRLIQRCLPKFFNHDEPDGVRVRQLYRVSPGRNDVTEKLDGSLIKVTNDPEYGLVITSKGSFQSDQAKMAKQLLDDRYRSFSFAPGLTYHFELISPQNKIVINYTDTELVLLCLIDNETGLEIEPGDSMFRRPTEYSSRVLNNINAINRNGLHEGVVVNYGVYRLKYKTDEYIRLHRVVTNYTAKRVWEDLSSGRKTDRLNMPEEFINWLNRTENSLNGKYNDLSADVSMAILYCKDMTNKEVATCPNPFIEKHKSYVLAYRSGKDVPQMMWRAIKPKGGVK